MFEKFKNWWRRQEEISNGFRERGNAKIQARKDKMRKMADGYINTMLTEEGNKKEMARSCLLRCTLAYPSYKVNYVGGHYKEPNGKEDVRVMIIPQGIILSNLKDMVPMEEIKNVSFKTESEIQKDVTLTRMVAFGAYALAMKKQNKIVTNYLIVQCEKNGMEYSMVFADKDTPSLYSNMFQKMAG